MVYMNCKQDRIKARLAKAGYASTGALPLFLAIQAGMMFLGAMAGGILGCVSYGMTQRTLLALLAGGGIGFSIPKIVLKLLSNRNLSSGHRPPRDDQNLASAKSYGAESPL